MTGYYEQQIICFPSFQNDRRVSQRLVWHDGGVGGGTVSLANSLDGQNWQAVYLRPHFEKLEGKQNIRLSVWSSYHLLVDLCDNKLYWFDSDGWGVTTFFIVSKKILSQL